MYEKKRNYELLKQSYQSLAHNYEKVVDANKSGRRLLGRYYRVAFYGQAYFEEDSGSEYVYKEPKVTSLGEISERLNKQYCEKLGQDVVKLIQDSSPVNQNELDPKFAYIQVTHVTPYFEKADLEDRQTEFEQNHDINCFMFDTPFTKDGKARGNPEEQWKRRTIITSKKMNISIICFSHFLISSTILISLCKKEDTNYVKTDCRIEPYRGRY